MFKIKKKTKTKMCEFKHQQNVKISKTNVFSALANYRIKKRK